jgi:transcription termination/antitermination protein NusG
VTEDLTTDTIASSSDASETPGDERPERPESAAASPDETPLADALEEVAEVHELADEAAGEVLAEAAVEAAAVEEVADELAEEIAEDAVDRAEAQSEAGDDDAAAETLVEGLAQAEAVHELGEAEAEETMAEAVIEVAVMEETADELGVELVTEAVAAEPASAETEPEVQAAPVTAAGEAEAPAPAPPAEKKAKAKAGDKAADEASPPADPFRGPGDWYVVHTYAGYENKVKANLESRIHTMQMEGKIFRVFIPMEDVMEIKSGKKQVVQKKVFPGYLLVKMIYDNDSWYVVRNTPGVTGFVSAGTGSKPTPLSKREVEKILVVKKEEVKPQFRLGFEEGDVVRIISGPFSDFNGTISEINVDQSKLKVLVNIFDRETPVELGFDQVSKV